MTINRNNYEIFFLDYFEGRLSAGKVEELMAFLELHYDLKEEFDSFENVSLPPAKRVVFDAKESLKKNTIISVGAINELNYEEFFIDALEGNLSSEQLTLLTVFIEKNPQLTKEYDLFRAVVLTPDTTIVFDRKDELKQVVHTRKLFSLTKVYFPLSVAASIILLLAVYFLMPKDAIKTINTASRNNFNLKRNVWENHAMPVIITNTSTFQTLAATTPVKPEGHNNFQYNGEYKNFQYASAIPVKTISSNTRENNIEMAPATAYGDFYAMMMKRRSRVEEQKPDDGNNVPSLKELALSKLKKTIAPADKKDNKGTDDSRITLWDIASVGVKKFNQLTGTHARLAHEDDNSTFLFALGDNFQISRSRTTKR